MILILICPAGYKYRPPPRLDRTPEEDQQSFMRHFSTEMAVYGPPIHCVNLAEKNGRERIITEAYLDQVTRLAFQIARKLSSQC